MSWKKSNVSRDSDVTQRPFAETAGQPRSPVDWLFLQPSILDQLHDSIIITDLPGIITGCNQAAAQMFGYTQQELIGQSVTVFYPEEDRDAMLAPVLQTLLAKGRIETEHRSKTKSGAEIYIHLSLTLLRDSESNPVGVVGVSQDITERRLTDVALQEQRQVLEILIESTADFVYMKDRDGRYVFANSSAARSVGKTVKEIIGKDDRELFPLENALAIMEKDRQIMASGISEVFEETRSSAGRTRHLHSSKNVCRNSSGAVIGMVGISRDITERKQVEEALSSSELNAAGARMANALAHEINNPLAAITNALFLLRQGSSAFPPDQLLSSAQEALWRITKITRQMIGLYNRNAPARHIQVQQVVQDTLVNLESRISAKGTRFRNRLDSCEFYGIDLDLRQMITALIENAVEQSHGVVWIRLHTLAAVGPNSRPGFRLTIADNGPGIPAELRSRIFEPFFSTKTEKASGLGLWMARGIANKYGGSIRVRSTTKEGASGTCVLVTLPSHQSSPMRRRTDFG
jgi:PAS domain S-box-containing protein